MHGKILKLFLAVIIMTLTMAGTVLAQVNYIVSNNSPVAITVSVQVACPGFPPISYITASVVVYSGLVVLIPVSSPPCGVTHVIVNGVSYYPMGYNGSATLPHPPSWVTVTSTRTDIW